MKIRTSLAAMAFAVLGAPALASSAAELQCLAETVYHEARGEPYEGQLAVAETIMNRVHAKEFPTTICGVTRQPQQFAPRRKVGNKAAYDVAVRVARLAVAGQTGGAVKGATYFHTPAVSPSWSRKFTRTGRIGNHIFYKP